MLTAKRIHPEEEGRHVETCRGPQTRRHREHQPSGRWRTSPRTPHSGRYRHSNRCGLLGRTRSCLRPAPLQGRKRSSVEFHCDGTRGQRRVVRKLPSRSTRQLELYGSSMGRPLRHMGIRPPETPCRTARSTETGCSSVSPGYPSGHANRCASARAARSPGKRNRCPPTYRRSRIAAVDGRPERRAI